MEIIRQAARLFGRRNRQYESLHEWSKNGWKIRVWRTEPSLGHACTVPADDLVAAIDAFEPGLKLRQMIEILMRMPRVACVAIVDASGNGVSAYPDWH